MKRSLVGTIAIATAVAVSLSACGSSGNAESEVTKVRFLITSSAWDVGYAPFAVAESQGYFEDEGIDIEFQTTTGPGQAVQLLEEGSGDVSPLAFQSVVQDVEKGGSLILFSNFYTSNIYGIRVPAGSDITDPSQLKGKTIGVSSLASGGVIAANAILDGAGLTPDDVKFVAIGVGGAAAEAVKSGRVDAVSLWDTQYALISNAGVDLKPLSAPKVDALIGGGLSALSDRVKKDPDVFAAIGRAVAKGTLFSIENPEAAVRAVWDLYPTTRGDADESVEMTKALAVLKARLSHVGLVNGHSKYGEVSEDEVDQYLNFLEVTNSITTRPEASAVQTNELIDQINDFDQAEVKTDAAEK